MTIKINKLDLIGRLDLKHRLDRLSPYPLFYPFVMTQKEKVVFDGAINKSHHYLEFGLGGSTLRAIQKSKAKIYTVESSLAWTRQMRKYLILKYMENKRLKIFHVDIGPKREWGYPKPNNDQNRFEAYSSNIFDSINCKSIDLVLIDGRFRVACTLKTIMSCCDNDNLKIMIHDFWNREHYHILLNYLDVERKADKMGLFDIKKNIDMESVKKDYEIYKLNPH